MGIYRGKSSRNVAIVHSPLKVEFTDWISQDSPVAPGAVENAEVLAEIDFPPDRHNFMWVVSVVSRFVFKEFQPTYTHHLYNNSKWFCFMTLRNVRHPNMSLPKWDRSAGSETCRPFAVERKNNYEFPSDSTVKFARGIWCVLLAGRNMSLPVWKLCTLNPVDQASKLAISPNMHIHILIKSTISDAQKVILYMILMFTWHTCRTHVPGRSDPAEPANREVTRLFRYHDPIACICLAPKSQL